MKTLITLLLITLTGFARAGVITLTAQSRNGTNGIAELTIGPYEVAELISFPRAINGDVSGSRIEIFKDGKRFVHHLDSVPESLPVVVAGPATLRLIADANYPNEARMCTVRVSPEAFPPDRTILLPPGTNQARITLECSTNLVHWFATTNGVYGPLPEAKFFRIKLEPL